MKVSISARIEKQLKDKVEAIAKKENRSFGNMLEMILIEYLNRKK